MKLLLNSIQMKNADFNTINQHKIPALVLMERAAMAVCDVLKEKQLLNNKIGILCGPGNNGADGIAIARILQLQGCDVKVVIIGDESKFTKELTQQTQIAQSYDVCFTSIEEAVNCPVIIDAIFGVGLSRDITGIFAQAIECINNSTSYVVSVDIPSGFSSDTGNQLGIGVTADATVTFSYIKQGLRLSECYLNCGEVILKDVGIYTDSQTLELPVFELENSDLGLIPPKNKSANKGSSGKVLIIAGSSEIYGACYLSAKAAMATGSGYVKIFTHENNRLTLQDKLPEAVCITYESFDESKLIPLLDWADAVLIGPGLSTLEVSKAILTATLKNIKCPLVIDADGINLLAQDSSVLDSLTIPVILTPHLMEMKRLTQIPVDEINSSMLSVATDFAKNYKVTVLLKNYTSVISDGKQCFINSSGSEALATAGSGDVLAGIVATLLAQGLSPTLAAALGAYIHGQAGVTVAKDRSNTCILASDIIDGIHLDTK